MNETIKTLAKRVREAVLFLAFQWQWILLVIGLFAFIMIFGYFQRSCAWQSVNRHGANANRAANNAAQLEAERQRIEREQANASAVSEGTKRLNNENTNRILRSLDNGNLALPDGNGADLDRQAAEYRRRGNRNN